MIRATLKCSSIVSGTPRVWRTVQAAGNSAPCFRNQTLHLKPTPISPLEYHESASFLALPSVQFPFQLNKFYPFYLNLFPLKKKRPTSIVKISILTISTTKLVVI